MNDSETTAEDRLLLRGLYAAFNARDVDAALLGMDLEVAWPNGMEGGYVHGHEGVRSYWLRQWGLLDPHVEPLRFAREPDGRIDIEVHQLVRDLQGGVLKDQIVHHAYLIENGRVRSMEIRSV